MERASCTTGGSGRSSTRVQATTPPFALPRLVGGKAHSPLHLFRDPPPRPLLAQSSDGASPLRHTATLFLHLRSGTSQEPASAIRSLAVGWREAVRQAMDERGATVSREDRVRGRKEGHAIGLGKSLVSLVQTRLRASLRIPLTLFPHVLHVVVKRPEDASIGIQVAPPPPSAAGAAAVGGNTRHTTKARRVREKKKKRKKKIESCYFLLFLCIFPHLKEREREREERPPLSSILSLCVFPRHGHFSHRKDARASRGCGALRQNDRSFENGAAQNGLPPPHEFCRIRRFDDRSGTPPDQYKATITRDLKVNKYLELIKDRSVKLRAIYEDKDGLRRDDIGRITGQGPEVFSAFYDTVRELRAYYAKYPNIPVEKPEDVAYKLVMEDDERTPPLSSFKSRE